MSPPSPPKSHEVCPLWLPPEIWESVILQLHPSEIPRLRLVNRDLGHLIDDSPELQYQLDLYAAGLEDGPRDSSFRLPERRKQLEQYLSGWENLGRAQHSHVSVPGGYDAYNAIEVHGGVMAHARMGPAGEIHFVRLPSPSKGITTKQWTIRDLPAQHFEFMMDPELDLLLLIEEVTSQPHVLHFLRISDGKPHPDAFSSTITIDSLQFYPDTVDCNFLLVQIGVRILLVLYGDREDGAYGIIVDWKTGERGKPWRSPSYDVQQNTHTLIDDHRILTMLYDENTDTHALGLLDTTSISKDTQSPTGVSFELSRGASFCIWGYRSLGRVPRHAAPFCLDHSRQIPMIVPVVFPHEEDDEMADLYIITSDRICALAKKFEGSTRIHWEEWKGSLTFVGDSLPRSPYVYSVRGLNLFVDVSHFVMTDTNLGVAFRVYMCSPRVRHTQSGVAVDAGLKYDSMDLFFDDWEYEDSETVAVVEYSEDNIIIHTATKETEEAKVHFLSF